ncbi:pyridoxal phosphate-dependent aminotransferase [bacterium]|nr:MAG: pyridoxal phosphate-dependent aminotransferase [bacterium]
MRTDTRLAERLSKINPSSTLVITAKAKKLKSEGRDIVNFAAGEPDFDTPDFIKDAAVEAIKSGFTKYTPSTGIPELKKLISDKFKRDNSLDYPPNQIVVSCGAKHSIYNTLMVLANRGDEVLIPSPYWVSYPEMVNLCEAKPVFIKTSPKNNFKIRADELKAYIGLRTKLLILNSPSNPAGSVYTLNELKEIAEICAREKIYVISDEIYEKLIYDNCAHISIASINEDIRQLTVTINGLSKSYSMTGWRIGYLCASREITEAISKLQDHSTSNPASISQKAAVAALGTADDFSRKVCAEFQKRRNYAISRLKNIKKIEPVIPKGAFYIFCDIAKTGMDSVAIANRLLEEASVSLVPGEGFGWNNYVRISFATGIEQLEKGFNRIQEWVKKL